ncbi:MAG: DUF4160 domain-containing protein [Planctomycetes bacterium]|nr:DUF4160 domain-containing protein [Planctomycetota bacterium]
MAVLLNVEGIRFFVPSREHKHPAHVHAEYGGCVSKWSLTDFECMDHQGCSAGDLKKIRELLVRNRGEILEKWHAEWKRRT